MPEFEEGSRLVTGNIYNNNTGDGRIEHTTTLRLENNSEACSRRNQFQTKHTSYQYACDIITKNVMILFKIGGGSQVIAYHPTSPCHHFSPNSLPFILYLFGSLIQQ
jgi:hypothetical protein